MAENEGLLTINEWLDVIGCDRCYRKDMKDTYNRILVEFKAQDAKTRREVAREIVFNEVERKHIDKALRDSYKDEWCSVCDDIINKLEVQSRYEEK